MDKRLIAVAIAFSIVGFIIGMMFGFNAAIDVMAAKAAKFINVNRSLIEEYLHMAGK